MNRENALLNEEPKKQVKKYRYFETKLYPDEDPKHEAMLIHLRTYHDVIHITHDKDFTYDDNNELNNCKCNSKSYKRKKHCHSRNKGNVSKKRSKEY